MKGPKKVKKRAGEHHVAAAAAQQSKTSHRVSPLEDVSISKRGIRVILIGLGLVVLGYIILTQVNPDGSNWAGVLSPFLLLLGYATIGVGILL